MQRLAPFLCLLSLSVPIHAQMYSWREGASQKIANDPPAWYRVDRPVRGPRVVVTQGKRVIDDTGLAMEKRLHMRPSLKPQSPAPVRRYLFPNY
jgi:hypothetical protein